MSWPILSSQFFNDHPPTAEFFQLFVNQFAWNEAVMPVYTWKNLVYVAACAPAEYAESADWPANWVLVEASPSDLQMLWNVYQNSSDVESVIPGSELFEDPPEMVTPDLAMSEMAAPERAAPDQAEPELVLEDDDSGDVNASEPMAALAEPSIQLQTETVAKAKAPHASGSFSPEEFFSSMTDTPDASNSDDESGSDEESEHGGGEHSESEEGVEVSFGEDDLPPGLSLAESATPTSLLDLRSGAPSPLTKTGINIGAPEKKSAAAPAPSAPSPLRKNPAAPSSSPDLGATGLTKTPPPASALAKSPAASGGLGKAPPKAPPPAPGKSPLKSPPGATVFAPADSDEPIESPVSPSASAPKSAPKVPPAASAKSPPPAPGIRTPGVAAGKTPPPPPGKIPGAASKPAPPARPLVTTSKQPAAEWQPLASHLTEIPSLYSTVLLASKAGNSVRISHWPNNLGSDPTEFDFSLGTPSPFRICMRTEKSYHGYIVDTPFLSQFFKHWNNGASPETLTVAPVLKDNITVGFVIAFGSAEAYDRETLLSIEQAATKLGTAWPKSADVKAS